MTSTFISNERLDCPFSGKPPLYLCDFQVASYNDVLYDVFKIDFPEQLKNAVEKRRAEFLVGRYCAAKSLSHLGITQPSIPIGKSRNPLWPMGIIGSISHCSSQSIAVTARASDYLGVGVDIEDVVSADTLHTIQSQIVVGSEINLISVNSTIDQVLFTLIFSAKESFFKAAFPLVNRYFDFFTVSLIDIDLSQQKLVFRINENLHEKYLNKHALFVADYLIFSDRRVVTQVTLS